MFEESGEYCSFDHPFLPPGDFVEINAAAIPSADVCSSPKTEVNQTAVKSSPRTKQHPPRRPDKMACASWKKRSTCPMFEQTGEYCAFDHPPAASIPIEQTSASVTSVTIEQHPEPEETDEWVIVEHESDCNFPEQEATTTDTVPEPQSLPETKPCEPPPAPKPTAVHSKGADHRTTPLRVEPQAVAHAPAPPVVRPFARCSHCCSMAASVSLYPYVSATSQQSKTAHPFRRAAIPQTSNLRVHSSESLVFTKPDGRADSLYM